MAICREHFQPSCLSGLISGFVHRLDRNHVGTCHAKYTFIQQYFHITRFICGNAGTKCCFCHCSLSTCQDFHRAGRKCQGRRCFVQKIDGHRADSGISIPVFRDQLINAVFLHQIIHILASASDAKLLLHAPCAGIPDSHRCVVLIGRYLQIKAILPDRCKKVSLFVLLQFQCCAVLLTERKCELRSCRIDLCHLYHLGYRIAGFICEAQLIGTVFIHRLFKMILINRLTIRTGSCFKGARYRFIKVCRKMNGIRISIIGFGKRHGRCCSVNDGKWSICRIGPRSLRCIS